VLVDGLDLDSGHDLHAELREPLRNSTGQLLGKSRQDSARRVEQNDGALRRINAPEVSAQGDPHHLRQGRRELHAGGARADQHEGHLSRTFVLVIDRFSQFERTQDFGPDHLGIAEVLEPRRILRELIVSEVARVHAGCNHQIIERDLAHAHAWGGRLDCAGSNVDTGDLRQDYAEVLLLHLDPTDGCGDVSRREDRRRHLIQQRLKYVVIAAVDQDDFGIGLPQRVRRCESGKSAADDHHTLSL
jgi:hypothetical protein